MARWLDFIAFRSSRSVLPWIGALLVLKVVLSIIAHFPDYFPPNFSSDFLHGRESYFWGAYAWAFYCHVICGPVALVIGTLLISRRFRDAFPAWHRRLGRMQVINLLLLVIPSGLVMAYHAATGSIAAAGLGTLAVVTGICTFNGWRAIRQRSFIRHERWMLRTYALLCSAVVIRMIGGAATVYGWEADWVYAASCWFSWLVPWVAVEIIQIISGPTQTKEN